jgi:hypothetical protein
MFWIMAQTVAVQKGLLLPEPLFDRLRSLFSLERSVVTGTTLILVGLGLAVYALFSWYGLSFGQIIGERLIKIVCGASLLTVLGFQLVFASFLLTLLHHPNETHEHFEISQRMSPTNGSHNNR